MSEDDAKALTRWAIFFILIGTLVVSYRLDAIIHRSCN